MKPTSFLAIMLLLVFCVNEKLSATEESSVREKINFNANWKFKLEDHPTFCETDLDDADWRVLKLPHDWSVEHDFSKENSGRNGWLPGGIGWYRKSFELPANFKGKHIEIQFDGVYKNASVWVNQHPVGKQYDGYTSFRFDITTLLNEGENVIAVRVDNSIQPNCRWYSGSGIYRNVWLNVVNPTHISTWGTFITTPEVSEEKASIKVVTEIENLDEYKELILETKVFAPNGEQVSELETPIKVARYTSDDYNQELEVANPVLWSVNNPAIYTAISTLKTESGVLDTYKSTFGIRALKFDAKNGFFLNGESMKMKGVCLHHDAGVLGAAVPSEVWIRRLSKLKALGCNAIRTAHTPMAPEFLNICDSLGFLVMNEFVDKWENPYKGRYGKKNPFYDDPFADPLFLTEWRRNYEETIRRDRNHPSVVIWSVGNENHPPGTNAQNNGLRKHASFVRSMDPTRPVVSGMERGGDKPVAQKVQDIIESCKYMDLIAMNYGEQWCKLIGEQNPGKPYVSTESYCYYNSELEKRFAPIERAPWIDVIDNDHNMGLFLWVGIDYLGESRRWHSLGSNSGLLDMAGFRKTRSYFYEAFWSDKPTVHLEIYYNKADNVPSRGGWSWPGSHTNWNLSNDTIVDAVTYTNCETVELYLNNKKIASQNLADNPNWILKWRDIEFEAGTLKAVGINDGKVVCESVLETTGKPHHLKENVYRTNDIVQVELTLHDKKGRKITHNDQKLNFALEGDAEILGLSGGNINSIEPFYDKQNRLTHRGNCLCNIKLNGEAKDKIKLTVSGEEIRTKVIEILP